MDLVSEDGVRASDRDREDAVTILCEAYAAGRLGLSEIRDRTAAAYGARTWGDLRRLTRDIPSGQTPRPPLSAMSSLPGAGQRHRRKRPGSPILLIMVALLAMAAAPFMPAVGAPLAAVALIVLSVSALLAAGIAATFLTPAATAAEYKAGDGQLYRDTI